MTKRDFASVACKILGLYFMANAVLAAAKALIMLIPMAIMVTASSSLPGATGGFPELQGLFISLLPAVVQFWIGSIIWRRADAIARRIAPEDS